MNWLEIPKEEKTETIEKPLWWHKRGLMFTATGYGSKIPTTKMLLWRGRKYRIYCCIWSNSGTCYICAKEGKYIVHDYM